ncbi:MAG: hypothetical protein NTX15_10225 [Candidatus Kapabacteria bacterium]|nr:hypothetical protein [Candidatus Kapabacteria bacterium]
MPSGRLSERPTLALPLTDHTTEFLIRRNMLPPLGDADGELVTLWAEFLCDSGAVNNGDRNNVQVRANSGKTALPDVMSHLGIEVFHNQDVASGLGVEIRSLRIETPHATDVLFGDFDNQIQDSVNLYLDRVATRLNLDDPAHNFTTRVGVGGNPPARIWRFYGRDEAEIMHWLVFRRVNILLDTTLITEVGAQNSVKQQHCLLQSTFWQGAGFNTSHDIAGYDIQRGYDRGGALPFAKNTGETDAQYDARLRPWFERNLNQRAGLKYGMVNMRFPQPSNQWPLPLLSDAPNTGTAFQDDPETFLEFRPKDPHPNPLPATADSLALLLENVSGQNGGIQGSLEAMLCIAFMPEPGLLFGQNFSHPGRYTPWISNVWPQMYLRTLAGNGAEQPMHHWAAYLNNRAKSGPEMRLSYWMPLVLGAKGFMVYKGISGTEDGQALAAVPNTAPRFKAGGTEEDVRNYETGIQWTPPLFPLASFTASTANQVINDEAFGPDYLVQTDPTNCTAFLMDDSLNAATGLEEVARRLNNNAAPAGGVSRIFMGMRGMRQTLAEVSDQVENMRSSLGRTPIATTTPTALHPLMNLRLQGWWGKGFGVINLEHPNNTGCLNRVFGSTISTRMKTRHPRRRIYVGTGTDIHGHLNNDSLGYYNYEPYDSSFVDLTLHAFAGEESMLNRWVIGVLNRRTDPRMMAHGQAFNTSPDTITTAQWHFVTHNDWNDSTTAHPEERYAQRGAREITVPFSYQHIDGRYRLLRVRELGGGIDTVIGQDRELSINMLPGEGKMLQVDVLAADERGIARGWLSHNTQRKMVVFPAFAGLDTVVRVHPDSSTNCSDATLVLMKHNDTVRYHMVYHRRLNPDPQVGPNVLSVYYRRSFPLYSSGGSEATFSAGGDVQWEEEIRLNDFIVPTERLQGTPSCGYPSIVVRFDRQSGVSKAYVVYACENTVAPGPNIPDISICEAQLWADAPTRADQDANYRTLALGSRVIDEVYSSTNQNCVNEYPYASRLDFWGTPVINASHLGNYYAWSDFQRGIVYGFKQPHERAFVLPQLQSIRLGPNTISKPMYPTLNSYSRLEIGEEDCALAWQDGTPNTFGCDWGNKIYYTHLRSNAGVLRRELGYNDKVPITVLPLFDNKRVALIYQGNANDYVGKPTIYRSLTDYDQSGFHSPQGFIDSVGLINHKADRIAWTYNAHQPQSNPPAWGASMIGRRAVDGIEDLPCKGRDTTRLWTNAPGFVFSMLSLENPELSLGEQKTVYGGAPRPQSWDYDDSSMVMCFDEKPQFGFNDGKLWQINFGWDLMGSPGMSAMWDPALTSRAIVRLITERGRHHHSAAKHSASRYHGLTMGRRIYEQWPFVDGTYQQAPSIGRSSEGFYKVTAAEDKEDQPGYQLSRTFLGYRGEGFDAMMSRILVDGQELEMSLEAPITTYARDHAQRVQSTWFELPEIGDLGLSSIASGESAENAEAWLERKSDGAVLPLNLFAPQYTNMKATANKTTDFQWRFVSTKSEQYRFVLECTDEDAGIATDIELEPTPVGARQGKTQEVSRVLDLRKMKTIEASGQGFTENTIEVIPQPASELVTVLIAASNSGNLAQAEPTITDLIVTDLAGREVLRTMIKLSTTGLSIAGLDVSTLPVGVYSVSVGSSNTRALMRVAR